MSHIIDAETGERIDVLHDRTAQTLTTWLREHPGAQYVCRDGSATYANPRELHQTGEKLQASSSRRRPDALEGYYELAI